MNRPPSSSDNPYASPESVSTVAPPGVLTCEFKKRNLSRLTHASLAIYCGLPAFGLLGWVALYARFGLAAPPQNGAGNIDAATTWLGVVPLTFLIVMLATIVVCQLNKRSYLWLGRQLAQRLKEQGIDVEASGGQFVQFSPADRPCFYEHHSEWDTGYLFLWRDRATYLGDQAAFSLRRESFVDEQVGPGGYQWPCPNQVYIDWRDPMSQRLRTMSLWPGIHTRCWFPGPEARAFRQRLYEWRNSGFGPEAPSWSELGPPRLDHIERTTQWQQLSGAAPIMAFGGLGFVSWLVGIGLALIMDERVPPGLATASAATTVAALLIQHFPLLYLRDISHSVSANSSEPGGPLRVSN